MAGDERDEDGPRNGEGGSDAADAVTVSPLEKAIMLASVALTVGLFAFAAWHAVVGAETATPTASVVADDARNDSYYVVTLRNDGDVGFVSVTVDVRCPDADRTLTFENVPGQATRNATVHCPESPPPPNAEIATWVGE